jgi:hypothetical protein
MSRDDIEVETGTAADGATTVYTHTIIDRKAGRAWSGTGATANAAGTESIKKFVGDRRVREYVGE